MTDTQRVVCKRIAEAYARIKECREITPGNTERLEMLEKEFVAAMADPVAIEILADIRVRRGDCHNMAAG